MTKRQLRITVVVCGLLLMLSSALRASSYPPFLRQAVKFGAQDCTFCHLKPEGGEGWNERGKWLIAERDRRKADSIDVEWLADYKPGKPVDTAGGGKNSAGSAAATLTSEERAKLIKLLEDSRDETLKAVENLSDAQWNYKPAPDKWSVGEVSEHILLSEGLITTLLKERVLTAPENPDWASKTEGKTELLEKALLNREQKAQAPEQLKPAGKLTRAEFITRFKEAREKTIKAAEENNQPVKAHTFDHPVFKTMNGYQWMLLLPLHNMRHNLQINEVKASAGFPK
ncbi:MAG TPA: DinB family protein [Blastocatellia bacterium]|nr:DinB family protein [Blastocatellia bacterium]